MFKMIIANRLTDGLVVFMAADGGWVEAIADGVLIDDEASGPDASARLFDVAMDGERNCLVVDPNLIDVTERAGVRTPTSYREEIRARGPSVQAEIS
jgi:sulfite reductase (NADPH) hemoprotein beta-component